MRAGSLLRRATRQTTSLRGNLRPGILTFSMPFAWLIEHHAHAHETCTCFFLIHEYIPYRRLVQVSLLS